MLTLSALAAAAAWSGSMPLASRALGARFTSVRSVSAGDLRDAAQCSGVWPLPSTRGIDAGAREQGVHRGGLLPAARVVQQRHAVLVRLLDKLSLRAPDGPRATRSARRGGRP